MTATINASTTAGVVTTADTSGILQLQTNGTAALTVDASQRTAFVAGTAALPAITTTGDTNTGIFFPAADTIAFSEGGAEVMRIDSSGRVGIGNTDPQSKLNVDIGNISGTLGQTNQSNILLGNAGASAGNLVQMLFGYATNATTYAPAALGFVATSAAGNTKGDLVFGTRDVTTDTAPTERARIFSTGNVSVGSPFDLSYKMALVSTSTSSPALYLRSTASGDVGTAQLRLIKADNTNTTSQIFIQFVIDGNNVNSGQINANGASQAAFGSFSDARLKENIVDLPSQLANITALRPVEFDYKDGCGHQIGFIAQEMEQVYPDAIGVGENEMLTITGWSKTEARLVKAIQELKAIVDAQGAEIAALKGATA
jgi:hypothetical protein